MTWQDHSISNSRQSKHWSVSILLLLLAILFFLFCIDMVAGSLTMLGGETSQSILLATSNPFIGLFIGLLSTALIQSSSTVTSMIVAVVASGYITLPNAIPVVMGANIGTTLTSTLVSLGFVNNRNEFRKAISAGSVHDFFNIIVVVVLFPLEYYYGTLSSLAEYMTSVFGALTFTSDQPLSIGRYSFSYVSRWLIGTLPSNFLTIILSLLMLFLSIKFLSKVIYARLIGESKDKLRRYVFRNPYKSFGWGTLITAGVQSSSITTSLMVPLVASGRVSLQNSFPFILGANIGTTITALIAAFNRTEAALTIAFVHMLINLIGVLIFLPFPALRKIPVNLAYRFGALTLDSRIIGFSYIIFTFFLLPFTLIYINRDTVESERYVYDVLDETRHEKMILVSKNKAKNNAQFLVYDKVNPDMPDTELVLPDTSFVASEVDRLFVTFTGVTKYGEQVITGRDEFGTYTLKVLNDTASYSGDGLKYSSLISLHKEYLGTVASCKSADLLVDNKSKMLISAHYFGPGKAVIKSIELKSVR